MNTSAYKSYKESSVETTDQGKLILIVYDFAIRNCKSAKEKLSQGNVQARTKTLHRAQQAITELMVSLNFSKGGDIAKKLYSLYSYMNKRLIDANMKKDSVPIDEVIKYLTELREAWVIAIQNTRKDKNPSKGTMPSSIAVVG